MGGRYRALFYISMEICDIKGLPPLRWAKICHLTGQDCTARRNSTSEGPLPCFLVEIVDPETGEKKLEPAACVLQGGITGDLKKCSHPDMAVPLENPDDHTK